MMLLVASLAAVISVNGSVAAMLPVVVVMAVQLGRSPSKLLMPLAFGAHAGSLLALTGTPVNVIVSNAAVEAGVGRFGFFEFALVGVPLVLGTIAIVVLFGERLLPHRSSRTIPPDFSDQARTLVEQYALTDLADTALVLLEGVIRHRPRPLRVGVFRIKQGRIRGV
jgi:Na+/H+ antiporter NhaD/arsenite permease-like protein